MLFKIGNELIDCKLCRDCKYFIPNGRFKSDRYEAKFFPQSKTLLGDCTHPIEPPYTRLKNETNGCDNWTKKELKKEKEDEQ